MSRKDLIIKNVEAHRQEIFDAERWLWKHPQVGFTEWEANEYLIEKFEALGYKLVRADGRGYGKIPGFYTDIETGKPGPCLCIMGELDALDIANHPDAVNGMAHACGHNAQGAAMLGIAAALKEPGALEGLCGTIRLMLVPAEETIQIAFREELVKKGVISYMGGKVEFMHRGYFDGVDLALMVHTDINADYDFTCDFGNIGFIAKTATYKGKSSHAGSDPHRGINAQYAAMLGLQACNDLRETMQDKDIVRFHPIMKGANCAVNIIPDEMVIESFLRAKTIDAMVRENKKINRALAGGALAMGVEVKLCDRPGSLPEVHDLEFMQLVEKCCQDLSGADKVCFSYDNLDTGSSDFGDVTAVMPGVQFYASGAAGTYHGTDYQIINVDQACMNSAKAQLLVADALLGDDAAAAKKIIDGYRPAFSSIKEYFSFIDTLALDKDAVQYDEGGNATVNII